MNELTVHALSDLPHAKVHGRTTGERSPLTLFWSGSALELQAQGSELWVELEADYGQYEPWITILINSVPVGRQMVTAGRHWVCLFRGMDGETAKNVRIVKDVQPMSGDPRCSCTSMRSSSTGSFCPQRTSPIRSSSSETASLPARERSAAGRKRTGSRCGSAARAPMQPLRRKC